MENSGLLLERDEVLASVDRLIGDVAAGQPAAIYVLGEPGLGKTSVLERACQRAIAAGLAVGLGRGDPMEMSLPFGLLAQALDAVGGPGLLGEDSPATGLDRSARFYSVLRWLKERAGSRILLAFDDMHWADPDSLALISFIGRRAESLALGMIACMRPWPSGARDVVDVLSHEGHGSIRWLAPLSESAAGMLLESRLGKPVADDVRGRAFDLCAGNPLLLGQLAVAIGNGEQVPPAAGRGRAAIEHGVLLARFAGLPPEGMRCAQAASVLGTSFLPEVAAQVAGLDGTEVDTAIEALGRTGLIQQSPGAEADFVHPLFRQALYDDLAGPVRTHLHARAFTVLQSRAMEAQAAEHAVLASLAGDPAAVAVLERAGRAARRAGALAAAVTRFDAAVSMAGDHASVALLLGQAETLLTGGHAARALTAYRTLLGRDDVTGQDRVEAMWMLGRALGMAGEWELAASTFSDAAELAAASQPAVAAEILLDASFTCWLTAGPVVAVPFASRARELAAPVGGDIATRADADWAQVSMMTGNAEAMAAAERSAPWRRPTRAAGTESGGWGPINSFAYCACLIERLDEADRAFTEVRAAQQQSNLPEGIVTLACGHAYTLCRKGQLRQAREVMSVALPLVEIVPLMESFAAVGMAYIELYTGNLADSARWCDRVEAMAVPRGEMLALLFLWDVVGHRRLREGAAAEASELYTQLERAVTTMGIGEPCLPAWGCHAVSAYVASGRVDDAQRLILWIEQAAERLPCRFPRIAAACGRAQLAELVGDEATAEAQYQAAMTLHDQVRLPLDQAETLLAYGGFLRRAGRPAVARQVLAQAIALATGAGASWLVGLARDELRVAGGRPGRRAASRQLTAQEMRVARLAASGATNVQIASQLYLAISTVETHLQHIYTKLGIRSRYELIARAADLDRADSD